MERKIFFLLAIFAFVSLAPSGAFASVVINEVAWMGTETSYADEWIELHNAGQESITLDGWRLVAADDSPNITLSGSISASGFYLLERTDDTTVPGIPGDWVGPFGRGGLKNEGEILKLFDAQGSVVDVVDASAGWFAGDKTTKQTMERKNPAAAGSDPTNWQTSQNPGGTPRMPNSAGANEPAKEVTAPPTQEIAPRTENGAVNNNGDTSGINSTEPAKEQTIKKLTATSTPPAQPVFYPDGIVINELLPSPEGSDEDEEWIEIFNQNSFSVDLTGWQITDLVGSAKTYIFPVGTTIAATGFLVLSRPITKITLNNSGDGLELKKPNGTITDKVIFASSPRGQSYNRIGENWEWSNSPTPGSRNILSGQGLTEENGEKSKNDVALGENESKKEEVLAKVSLKNNSRTLTILLLAVGLALSAGTLMLLLKKIGRFLTPKY